MNTKQQLGSQTAKCGFSNERDIAEKFNNWKNDKEAKLWLSIMGYRLEKIEKVHAVVLHGYKADVNVQVTVHLKEAIDNENISIKLVSTKTGFNQIDKRWVDSYVEMWNIPEAVINILKRYTGELVPSISNSKNSKRMLLNEFSEEEQNLLLQFIENNKTLILGDIFRGRGQFTAEWVLVVQKESGSFRWVLLNINEVINYYDGEVVITPQGNLKIGKVGMQRKGGDGGRKTANMLQFKINPLKLFKLKK